MNIWEACRAHPAPFKKLVPLDRLGKGRYKGESGGLYGAGRNEPPSRLREAALEAARMVRPLDSHGRPSKAGRVALISIGMSNTTQEYSSFKKLADRGKGKSRSLAVVDCAQGGMDSAEWARAAGRPWGEALRRLRKAGVSPNQVQAAWMKQARKVPMTLGEFPRHARVLERDMERTLQIARWRFPNLRLVFASSRLYGGYAMTPLNPEPYAYEGGFAVRRLISRWNRAGRRPVAIWGPYLWGDGIRAPQKGGTKWRRGDFGGDGIHPSASGQRKVARLLLRFFRTHPAARGWFRGGR